jgi:hypothetical protein
MAGATVQVRHRLDQTVVEIATTSGVVLARHRREPDGAGVIVRAAEHVAALERAVLAGFTDRAPCRSKQRRPPSPAALAEADRLRGTVTTAGEHVVVDLAAYAAAANAPAGPSTSSVAHAAPQPGQQVVADDE